MKKYKYELVPVLQPNMVGYQEMVNHFKELGYDGFELKAVENSLAFFTKAIDIPERDERKEENNRVEKKPQPKLAPFPDVSVIDEEKNDNDMPMRPVDEKEWIIQLLYKHYFSRKDAAKEYGTSERTFYRKMKEYGLAERFQPQSRKRNS